MMFHPTKHPTSSPKARTTLNAQALACRRGQRFLFAGLDFSLEHGRILILRGPNGSGKTSLLRLLAGLSRPEAGQLFWCGMAVPPSGAGLSEQVHYVGHSSGMKAAFSVTDNLRFWARYLGGAEDRLEASLKLWTLKLWRICRSGPYPPDNKDECLWRGYWWLRAPYGCWMNPLWRWIATINID